VASPQLICVHGIGGRRETSEELGCWLDALVAGMRAAGCLDAATALARGELAEPRFANYSDLFHRDGSQGAFDEAVEDAEAPLLAEMIGSILDRLDEMYPPSELGAATPERRAVDDARFRVEAVLSGRQAQGPGVPVRVLVGAASAVLRLPVMRQAAQWMSGQAFLFQLAQVGRYLDRTNGGALGTAARERILDGIDTARPLVVVAHSLGTVVSYEALHEYPGEVALWVTLGSPLALGGVVLDRIEPRPARCPDSVGAWHNFWDRDDIVAGRPGLAKWFGANARGVEAVTRRVDSTGLWTHPVVKYLQQAEVARSVAEALTR
jgi:hypothetical protein